MPNVGEPAGGGAASTDDEKVERKCPKCGKPWTKFEPTLADVRRDIREALIPFKPALDAIEKGMELGYRGSIARGTVGDHKEHAGMEPDIRGECGTKYDVDGYVLADATFRQMKPDKKGKRWAKRHAGLRAVEGRMRAALAAKPALVHMKKGSEGFGILVRSFAQKSSLLSKGPVVTLIVGG